MKPTNVWASAPGSLPTALPGTEVKESAGKHSSRREDTSVTVTLTEDEMAQARDHAIKVEAAANRIGLKHKFRSTGESPIEWQTRGYAAEIAVAKYLGVPWTGWIATSRTSFRMKKGDVAGIEVRNARRDDGFLSVYENDPDDRVVLLVTGTGPTFRLVGWMYAGEAHRVGRLHVTDSGQGSYRVEQHHLNPVSTLPSEVAA